MFQQISNWIVSNKELLVALLCASWYILREVQAYRVRQNLSSTKDAFGATTRAIEVVEEDAKSSLNAAFLAVDGIDSNQKKVIIKALTTGTVKALKGFISRMNLDEKTRAALEKMVDQSRD